MQVVVFWSIPYDGLPDGGIVFDLLLADGAGVALLAVSELVTVAAVDQQAISVVMRSAVWSILVSITLIS